VGREDHIISLMGSGGMFG